MQAWDLGADGAGSVSGPPMRGWRAGAPLLLLLALAVALPFSADQAWAGVATEAAIALVFVSGLNLLVGFAGMPAFGLVGIAILGGGAATALAGGAAGEPWPLPVTLLATIAGGAIAGLLAGLPALVLSRLDYAACSLGLAVACWAGAGYLPGAGQSSLHAALTGPPWSFYLFCLGAGALCVWLTANLARSRFGRSLLAIRVSRRLSGSAGISRLAVLGAAFAFAGASAALSGALIAATEPGPVAPRFWADFGLLTLLAVIAGGRGSVLGPALATVAAAVLHAVADPLGDNASLLYAGLLLVLLLFAPRGLIAAIDLRAPPSDSRRAKAMPRPALLAGYLNHATAEAPLRLSRIMLRMGRGVAVDSLDLLIRPGEVHGLLADDETDKEAALDLISGFSNARNGLVRLGAHALPPRLQGLRARLGIARTFDPPLLVETTSVLDNVMVGATVEGRASLPETMLALPRHLRDERVLRDGALLALRTVGLAALADQPSARLLPTERILVEIARALVLRPAFILLDAPFTGLDAEQADRLAGLIAATAARGTGVLLAERDLDALFDVCHQITLIAAGRVWATGTPAEIQARLASGARR